MLKTADVKKLIGKLVEWDYAVDNYRGTYLTAQAMIISVKGRNVEVDANGVRDWKWLPDMTRLRAVAPAIEGPGEDSPGP